MPDFRETALPINSLLFDPNNYRFQDLAGFVAAEEDRFAEPTVQDRAYRRIRDDGSLIRLKNSILRNGLLPVERVVVRPYPAADGKFLVLEGNRRLAALRWIGEDHAAGVGIRPDVIAALEQVPVVVVENLDAEPAFQAALMGIRHVSGIKEWGGYQRAKLVADLRDKYRLETAEIAERLAMSAQEVNRRYRAFKALQQMIDDEEYSTRAGTELYPIFHEALAIPLVREWLGWNHTTNEFTNREELQQFYGLITAPDEDGVEAQEPKLASYTQVRELKEILPNPEATRILLDPTMSFFDAVTVVRRDQLSRAWATQVSEAITALRSIPLHELKTLSPDDLKQIEVLRATADEMLSDYKKLQ